MGWLAERTTPLCLTTAGWPTHVSELATKQAKIADLCIGLSTAS